MNNDASRGRATGSPLSESTADPDPKHTADKLRFQPAFASKTLPVSAPSVSVRVETVPLPTYLPAAPSPHPMFLEKRVYQGSSGRVYPLPFTDRIAEKPVERNWKVIWLENELLRVMILPEIGGRIHAILDKTNGYDLIYNQPVIKPALVGLAGPWISGGIEINWPQHHRPATFLPVNYEIEKHADGSVTVWCGDHDPMARMKGMHGVCLHPSQALVELKARVYNRTIFAQSFLWWANVATRVHEGYQSFFPPDAQFVVDHARRSTSQYPLCEGFYYGVNYRERGRSGIPTGEVPRQFIPPHCLAKPADSDPQIPPYAPNDLSFYANIPTPCSYMCVGSEQDFFGGYDYKRQAGIVHVANHHLSPGKKQWTWGNHEFGYAWDRNLTDPDASGEYAPYIEIMAGVYTDNQPDFSFLAPGETRLWSQYWYPIQKIGPAQMANSEAALSLKVVRRQVRIGVCVTAPFKGATVQLLAGERKIWSRRCDLSPGGALVESLELPAGVRETDLCLRLATGDGREVISYQPSVRAKKATPLPATEPPLPRDIGSVDELYLTGLHLEQYRHATLCPTAYWREALRRDPLDARSNNALGLWHLRRGEFLIAEKHFRAAIRRLTARNANPYDGEAFYNLGLCLRFQDQAATPSHPAAPTLWEGAYGAFYKATWNQAWAGPAHHALAEMDCRRGNWQLALEHLDYVLRFNAECTRARNLKVMALRRLAAQHPAGTPTTRNGETSHGNRKTTTKRGKDGAHEAEIFLKQTLALDPLDWWSRHLAGQPLNCDLQTGLDLAHDFARAGFYDEAIALLTGLQFEPQDLPDQSWGAKPLLEYTVAWLHEKAGRPQAALAHRKKAAKLSPEYCHPARLEEIAVLQSAIGQQPRDPKAMYYLGNLLYDRRRYREAIELWERSAALWPGFAVVWRNLGVAYFNVLRRPNKARAAYERAIKANPGDARVLFERDQLWKRLGVQPGTRLRELEKRLPLVRQRDDLSVELCALYTQTGQPQKALAWLSGRRFQPWEGGEGGALGQYVRCQLALGRAALASGRAGEALRHFEGALAPPENLGEAKHLLANDSDVRLWLGRAANALGQRWRAREWWQVAARFRGDFQEMSVRTFSEMTYYSALAWNEIGQRARGAKLLRQLLRFAQQLEMAPAQIDYFATSLPTMLLFEDDLRVRQEARAQFMQAQAWLGLGNKSKAKRLLSLVLKRDPNHALAADLAQEMA